MNTTENNKIIAKFLGYKIDKETENFLIPIELAKIGDFKQWADTKHIHEIGYYLLSENQLCFDYDWNWLMEVVEKIYTLDLYYDKYIDFNSSMFFSGKIELSTKIDLVYNQCVDFITWYNQQTKGF